MKKLAVWLLAVGVLGGAAHLAVAGSGCCPMSAKKDKAAKAEWSSCSEAVSGLSLSDEQKAKVAEYEKSCKSEGCSKESCGKYTTKIREVLTDDQKQAFDAAMEKATDSIDS
ncbi:MAG: hypothetical protein H7A43_00915 [Verrucomicrobia bacterium]|nr:hypothetical protein [Kiritimatiellia bacterium]MCB1101712.1 hypothetical protein [Kiritimatiellia bacterium]MCP5487189.1 hypothetical protein [Verrucomicrobiota bacterium]